MDLKECEEKGYIRRSNPSMERAKSIVEISDIKEDTVKKAKLDRKNINAYIPLAYDSLREVMEAICILHGFKVANHICLGELIKSLHPDFDLITFDRIRYVRNSINYYGEKIELEQGKEFIEKMFVQKKNIKKYLKYK